MSSWNDYGYNGVNELDVTFSLIYTTLTALVLAMKERNEFEEGQASGAVSNFLAGRDKNRFPYFYNTQDANRYNYFYSAIIREIYLYLHAHTTWIKSIENPEFYTIDSLDETVCNILQDNNINYEIELKEELVNSYDRDFYKKQILKILDKSYFLRFKVAIDLMRFAFIPIYTTTRDVVSVYVYKASIDNIASTPAGAIDNCIARNVFEFRPVNTSAWSGNTDAFLTGNKRQSGYFVVNLFSDFGIAKYYIDDFIEEYSIDVSTTKLYLYFEFRLEHIAQTTNIIFYKYYACEIDLNTVVVFGETNQYYKLKPCFTQQEIENMFINYIDYLPPTASGEATLRLSARRGAIGYLKDGTNTFNFLTIY